MKLETLHTFAVNVSLQDAKGRYPYFPTVPTGLFSSRFFRPILDPQAL